MGWQENGRVAEWTDEQDRQIVAGWDDGLKAKQIAARMGRSGPAVHSRLTVLRRKGLIARRISRAPGPEVDELRKEINIRGATSDTFADLLDQGATIAAIAKAAGLSYSGAYKICAARAGRDKSQKTQVNVMLESHHVAAAQALGDGNITLGIKRAIERAAAVAQGETLFSGDEIREAVSRALADLTGRAKTKSPDA